MKKTRMIAILLSVIVMIILAMVLLPQTGSMDAEIEATEKVVVAAKEIPAYSVITAEMLTYEEYPESKVHPSALKTIEDAVGTTALNNISAREVLLSNHILKAEDISPKLSLDIKKGMRAATLRVDSVTGVSNLLRVGDFVDVVAVFENIRDDSDVVNIKEQLGEYVSVTALQNIEILALDQARVSAPSTAEGVYEYATVTLSVTPKDAEILDLCVNEGAVYLVLRGEDDHEIVAVDPVRVGQLIFGTEGLE